MTLPSSAVRRFSHRILVMCLVPIVLAGVRGCAEAPRPTEKESIARLDSLGAQVSFVDVDTLLRQSTKKSDSASAVPPSDPGAFQERGRDLLVSLSSDHFNKQGMKYHEYIAAGYPIGTGVVEGACRHFVKDRMELAGMRWEIEGAQAMLSLRALYLNEQWDDFIEYRIQTEQEVLYGQAA